MMIKMRRSGGRSGASASRKPALLDRTKGWRQAKVIKVVIIIPANVISMIIIIPAVVSSMIILMCRQEKRLALEEGLRRPPSQPLPSLRPLSQPPSLRLFLSSSIMVFYVIIIVATIIIIVLVLITFLTISGHQQLLCLGTHHLGSLRARNTSHGLPDR